MSYICPIGWLNLPFEVFNIVSSLPMPRFEDAAPQLRGSGENKDVLFWEFEQKVLGKVLDSRDQGQIGSCVGNGWATGTSDLLLSQIIMGKREEWVARVAVEPIYGGSRVQIGHSGGGGDGSVGAWAAKWVGEYGLILMMKYDSVDLSTYSIERCRQFGNSGCPSNLQTKAKEHPIKTVSVITTVEGARDALANGYPVPICGMTSRTTKRKPGGWCPKTGNDWSHCQTLRGVCTVAGGSSSPWGGDGAFPWTGDTLAFPEQNSWGDYLGSENATFKLASGREVTLPMGCYLSRPDEISGDLRQGDTFAISDAFGFPAQEILEALFKVV